MAASAITRNRATNGNKKISGATDPATVNPMLIIELLDFTVWLRS